MAVHFLAVHLSRLSVPLRLHPSRGRGPLPGEGADMRPSLQGVFPWASQVPTPKCFGCQMWPLGLYLAGSGQLSQARDQTCF